MYSRKDRKHSRVQTRRRIRGKIRGTAERPRIAIYRSLKHIYAQAIDDLEGATLVSASSREAACRAESGSTSNVDAATAVGTQLAERLKGKGIENAVFDRGGFRFHGRVKAVAEAARKAGLSI